MPGPSYASVCSHLATADWAGTGVVLILHLWKQVLSGEMTRSWCVALQRQGLLGSLFPAPALTFTGGCSAGQPASQAMAAFHGLGRPQLRAWFLFGEPSQKSSQGPDGVL